MPRKKNIAVEILKKELRDWKDSYKSSIDFYKGEETHRSAIKSFKEHKEIIFDLRMAIIKLTNGK